VRAQWMPLVSVSGLGSDVTARAGGDRARRAPGP